MAVNNPVNKKENKENFESTHKSFFYVFGIIATVVFVLIGIVLFIKYKRVTLGDTSISSISPLKSKFLLTATPNYF